MNDQDSQKVIEALHKKIESTIKYSFKNLRSYTNIESKVRDDVNEKMFGFIKSSDFQANVPGNIELRECKIDTGGFSGVIDGIIYLDYMKGKDFSKYGQVGYQGMYDEQIVNLYGDTYYQWDEFMHKWKDVSDSICGTDDYGNNTQSWGSKLTSNAAFDPLWGTNTNGGDLISDRHRDGADNLWGNPEVRSPMGIMKSTGYLSDLAKNMFKVAFKFSLDIKSAVSHYLKIEKALTDKRIKTEQEFKSKIDSIVLKNPMVKIRIEKIKNFRYMMNQGHIDELSNGVIKDTTVYIKDSTEVKQKVKRKNEEFKKRQWEKFQSKR